MKDDNVGSSLMFLGTIFHNLGPVYLIECLPYVAVLNLGITNSLLRKAYFVSDLRNRSAIYLGHILFLTLYMRVAMSCNLLSGGGECGGGGGECGVGECGGECGGDVCRGDGNECGDGGGECGGVFLSVV